MKEGQQGTKADKHMNEKQERFILKHEEVH